MVLVNIFTYFIYIRSVFSGCWFKYTFASSSDGLPINLGKNFRPWEASEETSGDAEGLSAHHGSG